MSREVKEKKLTAQQGESLKFFDEKAGDWEAKATGEVENKVNVVAQRNEYVLHVLSQRKKTEFVLDVGSGVGDLVCAIAERGVKATGIDIAGGMVDLAHGRAVDSRADLAEFVAVDYFDYHVETETYDLVSANGFVEYISYQQRDDFFEDAHRILNTDGSLVVSSRNRLFNLYSANAYTEYELEAGTSADLVAEAMALVQSDSLAELLSLSPAPLQEEGMEHAHTGVGVATRYQYTPVQLMKMLTEAGFMVEGVSPIHIHAGTPAFKAQHPAVHKKTADLLQTFAIDNWKLLPNASAFMVHARKQ